MLCFLILIFLLLYVLTAHISLTITQLFWVHRPSPGHGPHMLPRTWRRTWHSSLLGGVVAATKGVTDVSSPVENSLWNLCEQPQPCISPVKTMPLKFMLAAAAAITGAPYVSSPWKTSHKIYCCKLVLYCASDARSANHS